MNVCVGVTKTVYGTIIFNIDLDDNLTVRQKKNRVKRMAEEIIKNDPSEIIWNKDPYYSDNQFIYVDSGYMECSPNLKDILRLQNEFFDCITEEWQVGCWDVEVWNVKTDESRVTQGDVNKETTPYDFASWLIDDIEEMTIGDLCDLKITHVEYKGKDPEKDWDEE